MKNLLTIPVSYPKLLGGKLIVTVFLSLLFGLYSVAVTVLAGTIAGLEGFSAAVLLRQGVQVVAAAFNTCMVCMPMILIFGQMRGAYLGGSLLTFFLGYCILFFKSGFLLSAYPFSAALILAGFDMQAYNGATQAPSALLALAGMAAVLVLTMAILLLSRPSKKAGNSKKKKKKGAAGIVPNERREFMRNFNYTRKFFAFLCALFCIGNLSGCSTAMQSLADGTDAVLNRLADGTDIVMNGLADGTNQMLDSLAEADDGQLKDRILEAYGTLVDEAGSTALTSKSELKGRMEKGTDDYTGSYEAAYSDFTGKELLFGGTTLEREEGNTLSIACSLSLENGNAAIFLRSGTDDPVILLSESGDYTDTVEVDGTSTYIGVWGDHADGTVSIEIE